MKEAQDLPQFFTKTLSKRKVLPMNEKGLNRFFITLIFLFTSCTENHFKKLKIEIDSKGLKELSKITSSGERLSIKMDKNNLSIGQFINFSLDKSFLSASYGTQTQKYRMGTFKLKDRKDFFCTNQTIEKILI